MLCLTAQHGKYTNPLPGSQILSHKKPETSSGLRLLSCRLKPRAFKVRGFKSFIDFSISRIVFYTLGIFYLDYSLPALTLTNMVNIRPFSRVAKFLHGSL